MSINFNHKVVGIVSTDGSDESKERLIALAKKCGFGRNKKQIEGIIFNGKVYHWWVLSQRSMRAYTKKASEADKVSFSIITEKAQIKDLLEFAILKPEAVPA